MKRVFAIIAAVSALFLLACGKKATDDNSPSSIQHSHSGDPSNAPLREALLRDLLEAQLQSAAKMAREGKLHSAIHQVEVSQRMFPELAELATLRNQLVQRRDEAIRQQLSPPEIVLNRNQLPPADRISFSLLVNDWNAVFAHDADPTKRGIRELQKRITDFVARYPDFVEARLLQARLGLQLQERHDRLIAAMVISSKTPPPAEGPEAGAKLAQWRFDQVVGTSPELQELIRRLQEKGWYATPTHSIKPTTPAGLTPLQRIQQSLKTQNP